jgi:hypothetical protein
MHRTPHVGPIAIPTPSRVLYDSVLVLNARWRWLVCGAAGQELLLCVQTLPLRRTSLLSYVSEHRLLSVSLVELSALVENLLTDA